MKNVKELTAVFLALAIMLVNTIGFAYYTGPTEESGSEYHKKYIQALNTLYGLGIIESNDPDGYDEEISRADFADMVVGLSGGKGTVSIPEPKENAVTLTEAVRMLIDVSGNSIRAEILGDYPTGYLALAGRMGITYGLGDMNSTDYMTYGAAIQMIYNSMRVTPGHIKSISEGNLNYEFDDNCTMLSEFLNIKIRTGFMTADSFWGLTPQNLPSDDSVVINGATYMLKYPSLENYVGYIVDYYYSADEEKILAVECNARAKTVVMNGADVIGYQNNKYSYDDNGKEREYAVSGNAYISRNYVPDMDVNIDMMPANSDIILIDADGNGIYETVLIKQYVEMKLRTFNVEEKIIGGKGSGTYKLPEDKPARVYYNGKIADYSSVRVGTHVSVALDDSGVCREIIVSDKKVKGTVQNVSNNGYKMTASIDGTKYIISAGCRNIEQIKQGMIAEFDLNFKNEIAFFDTSVDESNEKFGYLIVMADDGKQISPKVRAKLLTEDGTVQTYTLRDKCKVNGSVPVDIKASFVSAGVTNQQLIYYKLTENEEITEITLPLADDTTVAYGNRKLHTSMETTAQNMVRYSSNSLGNRVLINDDTVTFSVPATYSTDEDEFMIYPPVEGTDRVFKSYNFEKNAAFADAIVDYRQNSSRRQGVAGGAGSRLSAASAGVCVVTSVTNVMVERYGEVLDQIEFVNTSSGYYGELILADNASWIICDNNNQNGGEVDSLTKGSLDLKEGDIFQYTENVRGEIGTVHKLYDFSENTLLAGTRWNQAGTATSAFDMNNTAHHFGIHSTFFRIVDGYTALADKETIVLSDAATKTVENTSRTDLEFLKASSGTNVYSVAEGHKGVIVDMTTLDSIIPKEDGSEKVFAYSSWGILKSVIVLSHNN